MRTHRESHSSYVASVLAYKQVGDIQMDQKEYQHRLASLCAEAFGHDTEAAVLFMLKPHPELDDEAPGSAASTELGALAVEEILRKGLHGFPV